MIGKHAPDFILADQHGKEFRLSEHLGKAIVLVFYPKDETPTCTKQLCDYNDHLDEFEDLGFCVIGISIDDETSHKNFGSKFGFLFPILSDTSKEVSRKYKALSFTGMSKRKIIIIDKSGVVQFVDERLPVFYLKSEKLLEAVRKISEA